MKRRIVRVCIMLLVCAILASCGSLRSSNKKHPFEKLEKHQTQAEIHSMLGEPDGFRKGYSGGEKIREDHYVCEFLGKTGWLELEYSFDEDSDEPLLENAVYAYYYYGNPNPPDDMVISDSEKDTVRAYYQEIVDYFSEEYGAPRGGFYEYEWLLPDGISIGLGLLRTGSDTPFTLYYDFT